MPGSLGNIFDVAAAVLAASCDDVLRQCAEEVEQAIAMAEKDDDMPCQPCPGLEQAPKLVEDLVPVGMDHLALVMARVRLSIRQCNKFSYFSVSVYHTLVYWIRSM
jgi:hypothetical protein